MPRLASEIVLISESQDSKTTYLERKEVPSMLIDYSLIIGILVAFMFIGEAGCGLGSGVVGIVACNVVCGAAAATCAATSVGMEVALASNPVTAPFVGMLAPLFMKGCGAGYAACMSVCVGGAFAAPAP